jgi:ElaB/YqjD/DUF883 family membrane-anchored ribosome-binding protein
MSANSALDPVLDKADETVQTARKTARNARDTYDEGKRAIPELARTAQKVLTEGVERLRAQSGDAADIAGEQIDQAKLYVVDRVQERPFTATLAALGAGFVLGLLFASHRR